MTLLDDIDNIIEHAGVRGMRWGVRKDAKTSATGESSGDSGSKKPSASEEAAKTSGSRNAAKKAKTTDVLSNKEMQDAITRMNLEQQYSKLTAKPKSAGKQFALNILKTTATMAATAVINQAVTQQLTGKGLMNKTTPQRPSFNKTPLPPPPPGSPFSKPPKI